MYKCSNCEGNVDLSAQFDDGCTVVRHAGVVVAAICPACSKDVKVTKIVLARETKNGPFQFDTLLNVESFK
jgi:hypothetical protein